MIGEFYYKDKARNYALFFFFAGLLMAAYYYISEVIIKRLKKMRDPL